MNAQLAIGIFDSGIGGLTVAKAIEDLLPQEEVIYLGDTARVPYGNKSRETIARYCIENTHFLLKSGVKVIVVACNTASALALSDLQEQSPVPVLGVIEPGALAAIQKTKNNEVGIIGTESTIRSGSYTKALQKLKADIRVWGTACPLFVPLAEEGWTEGEITEKTAQKYLSTFLKSSIDTLILGCTHYPLLKSVIAKTLPQVALVDSAEETARALKKLLEDKNLLKTNAQNGTHHYFVTDSPDRFRQAGRNFLSRPLEGVTLVSL